MSRTGIARRWLPRSGPVRPLALATLSSRTGRGLFYTILPFYLTRTIGVPATQVALGLTLASLAGLLAGVPAGHLADVVGPRGLRAAARTTEAALLCCYALVGNFVTFLGVACLVTFFESSGLAAEGALIARSVPAEDRVATRAYLRVMTNIGWALGAAVAAIALVQNTRIAYVSTILAAAACYLLSAAATLFVPAVKPLPRKENGNRWIALRDRPYLTLTALNAVLGMNLGLFTIALPLFITTRTSAPAAVYSVLVLLNTVLAAAFQVSASRGTDTVRGAARAELRSGLMLAGCCALFALAQGRTPWLASAVLVAGCLVHVAGELFQAAGSWGLSFDLAPEHAMGQYQGLFGIGRDLGQILTPVVATDLMVGVGWPGCLLLGGLFLLAGVAVPPAARWAERERSAVAPKPA